MAKASSQKSQVAHSLVPVSQRDITLLLESGYLFIELGKHKEAEEIFVGVAALIPQSEVPHLALGNLHFAQGHFSPALKSHQQALVLNKESAIAHASAAESLFFLKRNKEALVHLDEAMKLADDGTAHEFAKALKEAYDLELFH
jgi:tetratricopeptide (TPR) repeat protein